MMASMQAEGQRLIHESEHILRHDVQSAWEEQDFNLAVRRAQEVVELCLKGALRMLGLDYPRVHDVGPVFSEQARRKLGAVDEKILDRIEDISFWLSQARAPSFYFEREYSQQDAEHACQDGLFVVSEVTRMLGLRGEPA